MPLTFMQIAAITACADMHTEGSLPEQRRPEIAASVGLAEPFPPLSLSLSLAKKQKASTDSLFVNSDHGCCTHVL
jgi:hypothetical protein